MTSFCSILTCSWLFYSITLWLTENNSLLYANNTNADNYNELEPYMAFAKDLSLDEYAFALSFLSIQVSLEDGAIHGGSVCAGSLIHKYVILTAGHCKKPDVPNKLKAEYHVYTRVCSYWAAQHNYNDEHPENFRKVSSNSAITHERYIKDVKKTGRNFDIMLLFLDKPFENIELPSLYGCPAMFKSPDSDRSKKLPTFGIGCGTVERTIESAHNLHELGNTYYGQYRKYNNFYMVRGVYECMSDGKVYGGFGDKPNDWNYALCNVIPDKHHICKGDSGGPLMYRIDNKIKQIGIARECIYKNKCEPFCGCLNVTTIHMFLYMHREWIIDTAKNRSYDVPFEDCTPKWKLKWDNKKNPLINIYMPKNSQCTLQPSIVRFPYDFCWTIIYVLKTIYRYFIYT